MPAFSPCLTFCLSHHHCHHWQWHGQTRVKWSGTGGRYRGIRTPYPAVFLLGAPWWGHAPYPRSNSTRNNLMSLLLLLLSRQHLAIVVQPAWDPWGQGSRLGASSPQWAAHIYIEQQDALDHVAL